MHAIWFCPVPRSSDFFWDTFFFFFCHFVLIQIYGLYTGTVQRHSYPHAITVGTLNMLLIDAHSIHHHHPRNACTLSFPFCTFSHFLSPTPSPLQTVALDPRFSGRKTQEFIYGTAAGALVLSSKGWLGHSETVLFRGRGPVHIARMSGTLLAWATDSGIRVYDTSTHGNVGKIDRPSSVTPGVECGALEWVGKKQLFIAWGMTFTFTTHGQTFPRVLR